ncbi:C2H2 type zinc finger domain-containing protein 9 [Elsinoe australis]|uniref:C2H2 type zinc finger domain-containing protein 9 n=1 Tax=Elsinoe australis TaxID=40998 RepID=A0A4U7AYW3_9PEZI|nr:C2H2 type zinc finger domain-containing protein 9 [Elsinoe australis]
MAALPVKCTYIWCGKSFATEKDMKSHKHHDPEHHYCRKCDYDAKDWDDMLDHKVEAMAPFIIGDKRHDKHKKMKHLCCEYCSEDFKSMEGRMNHRREMHQAAQYIECQGCGPEFDEETDQIVTAYCGMVFMRPSQLIEHYERGKCPYVSSSEFKAERQHKHIVKQILADPDVFSSTISASRAMVAAEEWSEAESEYTDISSQGGVGLLDDNNSTEAEGYETLVPRLQLQNLIDQDIDNAVDPVRKERAGSTDISSSSLVWPRTRPSTSRPAPMVFRRGISSSRNEVQMQSPTSPPPLTNADTDSDSGSSSSSEATARAASPSRSLVPSTHGSLASYMSEIRSTTTGIDWAALARTRALNESLNTRRPSSGAVTLQRSNLFTARWYDPHSPSYNPDLFWSTLNELYTCPFGSCDATFEHQIDMETHLRYTHVMTRNKCPTCLKTFETVTGLVRHFEASVRGSRCWIATTRQFAQVLCEVTGGFLDVTDVGRREGENKLAGYVRDRDGSVVKVEGEVGSAGGVMEKRFDAATPEGFEERKWEDKGVEGENERRAGRVGGWQARWGGDVVW